MWSYGKWILVAVVGVAVGMIASRVYLTRPPSKIPQLIQSESSEASAAPNSAPATQKYYSPVAERFTGQLYLRKALLLDDVPEKVSSPNGIYWYGVFNAEPNSDPTQCALDGVVYIHTGKDHSLHLVFYNQYATPEIRWINDKLLYFEVRWGKSLGGYAILDVEQEELLVREMFTDGEFASPEAPYDKPPRSKRN